MKKFSKEILFFFVFWLCIAIPIDLFYTKHLLNSNIREVEIWEDIINDKLNAEMVILGSSRAADHYQPAIIDSITRISSYNLGQYGKGIEDDLIRYNLLKKHSKHLPKYIVWDLYFNSFNYSGKYYDDQYTPFLFNKDIWGEINKNSAHFSILDKDIPLLRYWKKNMLHDYQFLPNPYKGFVYNRDTWHPEEMQKLKNNPINCSMEKALIDEFRNTVRDIKDNGSEVILVFSPLYYQGQYCVNNLSTILDTIQTIASEEKCPFLNYLYDTLSYDSTYFKNAMHLNERGTDAFSAKFAYIFDSLLYSRNIDS